MSFEEDVKVETYKSLISISVEGFKTLLLINSGAVVAILAYLGQAGRNPEVTKHAWLPLGLFVLGIIASVLAFFGSYTTQFLLYGESVQGRPQRHPMFVKVTAGLALLSALFFAGGAVSSLSVLTKYTPSTPIPIAQPTAQLPATGDANGH